MKISKRKAVELLGCLPECLNRLNHIKDEYVFIEIMPSIWEYLLEVKKRSYKDFLTYDVGLTEKEYFKQRKDYLTSILVGEI